MTALANNRIIKYSGELLRQFTKDVIASDIIYKGAMVGVNSSGDAGPCGASGIGPCLGVAMAQYDNSAGAAGAIEARLQCGVYSMTDDGSTTEADLPATMYAVDDQTVSLDSAGTRQVAGIGVQMDGSAAVKIAMGPSIVADLVGSNAKIVELGSDTLVAGTVTVASTHVRADSEVLVFPIVLSGSADFAYLSLGTIVAGVSFIVAAFDTAHSADTDAVGTFGYIVVNP